MLQQREVAVRQHLPISAPHFGHGTVLACDSRILFLLLVKVVAWARAGALAAIRTKIIHSVLSDSMWHARQRPADTFSFLPHCLHLVVGPEGRS